MPICAFTHCCYEYIYFLYQLVNMALDIGPVIWTSVCMHKHAHAHTYTNTHQRWCDILVAFASGCCRAPFGWAESLYGPTYPDSCASLFNGWLTFLYTATTFLDAWSLILLLFKSDMSDYAVLALHDAAKIRWKIQRWSGLSWQQTNWNKRITAK